MLKNVFFISMCLLFSGILYASEKLQKKCPDYFHLLSEEHATTVMEYNRTMQEGVAQLDALNQYLEYFVTENTFESCLRSIKDTMMDSDSTKDKALEMATCFNVDDFSTPNEGVEVEAHIIADVKKQLSGILELIKQRLEIVYGTSSFEQREAAIICTSYSKLW